MSKKKIKIIEDCAEAFGTTYKKNMLVILEILERLVFGNKTITTGEGGILVFKKGTLYFSKQIEKSRDELFKEILA